MKCTELALFDFDGTITSRDTLIDFIIHTKGRLRFIIGFSILSPILVLNQLKLFPSKRTKELVLAFFFKETPMEQFQRWCDDFSEKRLPMIIRSKASEYIRNLQERNVRVIIVSASPQNWIAKWASSHNIEVIATRLEVVNGRLTGRIVGENCHGVEKINRIKNHLNLEAFTRIYAFGDTSADKPMLSLATDQFYRPFRN